MSVKALLVDPDQEIAAAVRERLIEVGCCDVVVRDCAEDALCLARDRNQDFDLVYLDLDVIDIDGFAACRRLASLLADVPIIACSKRADEATVLEAFEAGAHDFVAKPFRLSELVARARSALRLREERRRRWHHERRLVNWAHQLEKSNRDLESTVCIDPLTGIANRRHFDTLLNAEWRRAARDGTELSLVIFDLDDFHAYNDQYGHVGGDGCLVRVAKAMAHSLRRASDVLARYGGEELVAVLPETDAAGACVVAERLRARVEELRIPHAASRTSSVVTFSAGVATRSPAAGLPPEMLITAADAALFRAKRNGRNCCRADGLESEQITVSRRPWPKCPVVVVDPVLAQRVPRFLDTIRADIAPAPVAAAAGDFARISTIGQHVKRGATPLGFEALAELGTRLEAAARSADRDATLIAFDELGWYVEHVQVVYRRAASRAV